MPDVNYLVHGHGEYATANIVEQLLGSEKGSTIKGSKIDGCKRFNMERY